MAEGACSSAIATVAANGLGRCAAQNEDATSIPGRDGCIPRRAVCKDAFYSFLGAPKGTVAKVIPLPHYGTSQSTLVALAR